MNELRVDVWSDIACPWCWVGKRHLETAIESFEDGVAVTWRAFELDPSGVEPAPETSDYVQRLATKYRTSRAEAQGMIDRMVQVGRENGLDFRFDRVQPTNTFDAHRLLSWAAEQRLQTELEERLFAAYMTEGRLVSDHGVLAELAADVGLDAGETQAVLSSDAHANTVRSEERRAAQLGVTGVPFFVVGNRYAVSGAQPAPVLVGAMRQAWSDAAELVPVQGGEGSACGPEGCAVDDRAPG